MVYIITNERGFDSLWNGRFYQIRVIGNLVRKLQGVNYGVVGSRREGHESVMAFVNQGIDGLEVFDVDRQFRRDSRADTFVSDTDMNFTGLLTGLTNTLSYRDTNVAKDTGVGVEKGKEKGSESVELAKDQGKQDNTKRFEELVKKLSHYAAGAEGVWNRARFEREIAVWHAAQAPPLGGGGNGGLGNQ